MGSSASGDYCAFTKAVERLGDRWSLLIVRELVLFGRQGFNSLAAGLPGHISRSVLTTKLRMLEELGIVARLPAPGGRSPEYLLTPAGEQLRPVVRSLWGWAEKWMPHDPALAQRDPGVIVWWLAHRVDVSLVPERQVVLEIAMPGADVPRGWLLLARGAEPTLCAEDPVLDQDRYIYVDADPAGLYPIARGLRAWTDAVADRSVRVYGEPELVRAFPSWFIAVEPAEARYLTGPREEGAALAGRDAN
jgi:DNA-binding HxlR family transcriptional regulator